LKAYGKTNIQEMLIGNCTMFRCCRYDIILFLISLDCVFDASLVPGTCLDGFVDLKGFIQQVPGESRGVVGFVRAGSSGQGRRDSKVNAAFIDETTRRAQTPALFDFHKQNDSVVLDQH
jgi:hypothetical protein